MKKKGLDGLPPRQEMADRVATNALRQAGWVKDDVDSQEIKLIVTAVFRAIGQGGDLQVLKEAIRSAYIPTPKTDKPKRRQQVRPAENATLPSERHISLIVTAVILGISVALMWCGMKIGQIDGVKERRARLALMEAKARGLMAEGFVDCIQVGDESGQVKRCVQLVEKQVCDAVGGNDVTSSDIRRVDRHVDNAQAKDVIGQAMAFREKCRSGYWMAEEVDNLEGFDREKAKYKYWLEQRIAK